MLDRVPERNEQFQITHFNHKHMQPPHIDIQCKQQMAHLLKIFLKLSDSKHCVLVTLHITRALSFARFTFIMENVSFAQILIYFVLLALHVFTSSSSDDGFFAHHFERWGINHTEPDAFTNATRSGTSPTHDQHATVSVLRKRVPKDFEDVS